MLKNLKFLNLWIFDKIIDFAIIKIQIEPITNDIHEQHINVTKEQDMLS